MLLLCLSRKWWSVWPLAYAAAVAAAPAAAVPSMEAAVAEAAREALHLQAERDGLLAPEIEVSVSPVGTREAPRCAQAPLIETMENRFASRMRFAARCPGVEGSRTVFVVRGSLSAEVVVAATSVASGKPIAASDLMLDRRDVSSVPDPMSDIEEAAGQAALRPLRPGQVLQKRLLSAPVLVKRGDVVVIEARSGPVQVTASGEALEPGKRGEVVRVRNVNTGKVIRARVMEAGTVQPADMP
ncbi:flagellar basal body P-ring formation chaperone FlgA [Aquincola tertiaricarbonis]|uniref:flagellar basal body P-ring formation chaperone FlgA n=1 Tax=Aquincola tertiaricarbonis TaxID=391953 RepID=UPI0018DE69AD|nr:flagellar basal body P-ring formation chaperone FlgA [Aquincola tertiaricarbonis]